MLLVFAIIIFCYLKSNTKIKHTKKCKIQLNQLLYRHYNKKHSIFYVYKNIVIYSDKSIKVYKPNKSSGMYSETCATEFIFNPFV